VLCDVPGLSKHRFALRCEAHGLVKTSQPYFLDTGLACWRLGVPYPAMRALHSLRGALCEALIVAEFITQRFNAGQPAYEDFWLDNHGLQADLLLDRLGSMFGHAGRCLHIASGRVSIPHPSTWANITCASPSHGRCLQRQASDCTPRKGFAASDTAKTTVRCHA